jgi:pyruvate/2-oxoglutarate dehydrogenase complex dihydrolipoamide acyltransferase (E2) component
MTIVRIPPVEDGTFISQVHIQPGTRVSAGNPLVTLETPSLLWDIEAQFDGYVHGLYLRAGQHVAEGAPLASLCDFPLPSGQASRVPPTKGSQRAAADDEAPIHPEIARIMEESARRAIEEVDLEMKAAAEQWTPEQVFAKQQLRTIELFMPASNAFIASIREDGWRDDLLGTLEKNAEVLRAVEKKPAPQTSLDQLVDVWSRHPFLVGWFGADFVHKLRRR